MKNWARKTRAIVEWDWVVVANRAYLHAPKKWHDPKYDAQDLKGSTVCGLTGLIMIPGLFSRLGAKRCPKCCKRTGMPSGTGSPKNDKACRPIARARLKKLRRA